MPDAPLSAAGRLEMIFHMMELGVINSTQAAELLYKADPSMDRLMILKDHEYFYEDDPDAKPSIT